MHISIRKERWNANRKSIDVIHNVFTIRQREQKLKDHLRSLQDLDSLLEELLAWLQRLENQLLQLESVPLPDEIPEVERLIEEHKDFMENMSQRQHDIDTVCKTKPVPLVADKRPSTGRKTPKYVDVVYGQPYMIRARKCDFKRDCYYFCFSLKSSRDNLLQDKHGRLVADRMKLITGCC